MDSKRRFSNLEVMCRELARLADNESNYWLAEAEEWAQLGLSCNSPESASASLEEQTHSDVAKA
jgi:hypothetical protein